MRLFLRGAHHVFRKNANDLALENTAFAEVLETWKAIRTATTKKSALRSLVHDIVRQAQAKQRVYRIAQAMGDEVAKLHCEDAPLMCLPPLTDKPAAVEQWFTQLVYPDLQRRQKELQNDPEIARIRKAFDKNGKFQLSRLEKDLRANIARIARLPRSNHFNFR